VKGEVPLNRDISRKIIILITFFNWKKNSYGNSVILKKMSSKMRILFSVCFVIVWCAVFLALEKAASLYSVLDNTVSLLGFACRNFIKNKIVEIINPQKLPKCNF